LVQRYIGTGGEAESENVLRPRETSQAIAAARRLRVLRKTLGDRSRIDDFAKLVEFGRRRYDISSLVFSVPDPNRISQGIGWTASNAKD
ncbi:MAG: hypothetical protein ABGX07_13970, partial [Pirellulaceae bacterium]